MARVTEAHELEILNMARFESTVARLRPGRYLVTVEEEVASRSERQNKYYFAAIVSAIQEYTGDDQKAVHNMLKAACNPVLQSLKNAKTGAVVGEYWEGGSTKVLSVKEFSDYIERCQQWAAEHCGIVIADANPEERAAWQAEEAA